MFKYFKNRQYKHCRKFKSHQDYIDFINQYGFDRFINFDKYDKFIFTIYIDKHFLENKNILIDLYKTSLFKLKDDFNDYEVGQRHDATIRRVGPGPDP